MTSNPKIVGSQTVFPENEPQSDARTSDPLYASEEIPDVKEDKPDIMFSTNRIFINHIDQFNARHITEYLTEQTRGVLKNATEIAGEDQEEAEARIPSVVDKYECIGTLKYRFGRQSEDVSYIVSEAEPKGLENELIGAGCVIYDISRDPGEIPKALKGLDVLIGEIESVKEIGPKTFKRYDREYIFILISNIFTWGKTKPIDRDDPTVPFTEADYKKRKPGKNYEEQIACEREVVLKGRKYKGILNTYVLCCGMPYGFEEDIFFPFFKMAWENKDLPIFQPGTNYIPLVHIQDVAKVIHAVIELLPKKQYILVVEQIPSRHAQIMRALARSMGKGVKEIPKEEAFLYNVIDQKLYDMLTINLKMEPAFILDELGVAYRNDLNFGQNIDKIVMEFRMARNLVPMKVFIHGPVASGRTCLANHINDYYGLHYVSVKTMIEETAESLRTKIDAEIEARKLKGEAESPREDVADEGGEEAEEEYEPAVNLGALQRQLKELETTLENNNNILPEEYMLRLMRQFLASNICQNQGYVLDAFPKTMQQCKALFGPELDGGQGAGGEGGDYDEDEPSNGRSIVPQFIISLEADDEYLVDVMINYPDKQGEEFEEESMLKRLKLFRENNTEDNTLLNFFDEHEIHPINISIMNLDNDALFLKVHDRIGQPFGFEPTPEEQEERYRCQHEANILKGENENIQRELLEREALEEYQINMEERIRILDELQKEEEKLLTVQCEPLRHYLMMHVFPTLTNGLLEIARIKPVDPVDYLAEYLFKFNPEGKMFDPTYTRRGELIQNETKGIFVKKSKHKKLDEACNN